MSYDPNSWRQWVPRVILVPRLIVLALVIGVAAFAGVAIFLRNTPVVDEFPTGTFPMLTAIGASFAALLAATRGPAVRLIVSKNMERIAAGTWQLGKGPNKNHPTLQMLKEIGDAGPVFFVFIQKTIVSVALLEAAALLNVIAFLIEGSLIPLGVAAALVAGLLLQWPNQSVAEQWVTEKLRQLEQMRLTSER